MPGSPYAIAIDATVVLRSMVWPAGGALGSAFTLMFDANRVCRFAPRSMRVNTGSKYASVGSLQRDTDDTLTFPTGIT